MVKEKITGEKKCTVIHIPVTLLEKIESIVKKKNMGKNAVLVEILEKGLKNYN